MSSFLQYQFRTALFTIITTNKVRKSDFDCRDCTVFTHQYAISFSVQLHVFRTSRTELYLSNSLIPRTNPSRRRHALSRRQAFRRARDEERHREFPSVSRVLFCAPTLSSKIAKTKTTTTTKRRKLRRSTASAQFRNWKAAGLRR